MSPEFRLQQNGRMFRKRKDCVISDGFVTDQLMILIIVPCCLR